jgi:ParB-like chromosome segregation protein Spo0J
MSEPLKFHPLADIFPLMEGAEFEELVADIKANGLREKIDLYQGKIVDGRNRYRALQRLEIDPSAEPSKYFRKAIYAHSAGGEIAPHEQDNDARVRAYIISKNIHRRHLTVDQKSAFLVELVKASPEKSDRTLAKEAGTTHPTIAKARKRAEATGKALPVEKRTGADGKARKQPAKKKRKPGTTYWLEGVNGRSTPQRVSREEFLAAAPAMKAEAEAMEAEDQETLYDQACLLLESMTDATRQRFFAHLRGKYLNALGKPISPSYDPKYKVRTPLTSINRLRVKPPKIRDAPPQDIGDEHVNDFRALMEEAFSNKAKLAALDDGLDLPESLRRAPA